MKQKNISVTAPSLNKLSSPASGGINHFTKVCLLLTALLLAQLSTVPATTIAGTLPQLSPRPVAVPGVSETAVALTGTWRFNGTANIQVPGEWVMQGFNVKSGKAANYERTFTVPEDWSGQKIKLRCGAVFSAATVWMNGQEAGKHLGGFTPFELDVTALVKPGAENVIKLAVISESAADTLASGSRYAFHPLGGITRGIQLFVLPVVNLSGLYVVTKFDKDYRNATLELDIQTTGNAVAALTLIAPDGADVPLSPNRVGPGHVSIPVAQPLKWDPEHPNLYRLTVKLEVAGKTVETVTQRVGFRQIEVRGDQMFVNNRPVKLRGSNHHEIYPTTGRSVPAGLHRRDIELFREANVNLLRTCHYPPDEALMEAADELGMFIECEAPFCSTPANASIEVVCSQTAEMVLTFRNHPSVLFWSLANESEWGPYFAASSKLVRQLDPSRPQTFNWRRPFIEKSDEGIIEIANMHYPNLRYLKSDGVSGPEKVRAYGKRPVYFGEDTHVNCYNRPDLAIDPAVRDSWGRYLREHWDEIYRTQGCLGQSIWSGVDEVFYFGKGNAVGYGAWGIIDGWRRTKPEWWNTKKAYSPVRLDKPTVTGNRITLGVENRQLFSNLSEMKIAWKFGAQSGTVTADAPPAGKGTLSIAVNAAPQPGDKLELTFTDPRGFVADEFAFFPAGNKLEVPTHPTAGKTECKWDKQTGMFTAPFTGPQLMVLPLNSKTTPRQQLIAPCSGWVCQKVEAGTNTTTVTGKYDGAAGSYTYTSQPGGGVEIAYTFTITKPVSPRQIGLVFTLPRECEVFSWERRGYWDVYPEDHIARLKGTVKASEGFPATPTGPRTKPSHPWRLDNLPDGNNDFCSTKHNVLLATVLDAAGHGLTIDGQGQQHVRCWRDKTGVHILVADYSNGGSEWYLGAFIEKEMRPLKIRDKVSGTIRLNVR